MQSALAPAPPLDMAIKRGAELEAAIAADPTHFRILTGDRPTGPLHVGHYFGTLANRVRLQDLGVALMVLIADYQTITDRDSPETLPADVLGLLADYLAVGIDPERATIFAHSQIAALNQLLVPMLSLVSMGELTRNPTVKEELEASGGTMSGLMLTYPVHQAADILFGHANLVPVGKDQLPHIELTRRIARRFNERYSPIVPYFDEPEALLGSVPLLLGTDGQKMSKSRGNAIPIGATADETAALIRAATTDAERQITYEPERRPHVANLLVLAGLCLDRQPGELAAEVGGGGAAALKALVTEAVNERFAPIRARRVSLAAEPGHLRAVLGQGNRRASERAETTLAAVRELMHTAYGER
jgi:tryptophanyl-tRNA synthetase